MDQFAELLKDCQVGQAVREQRERQAADAARATLAKARAAAAARAEANSTLGQHRAMQKSMREMGREAEALARTLNPNHAIHTKIAEAEDGIKKALGAGKYDLACKLEWHRNAFLQSLI